MMLGLVSDTRVVLIKLADRLHNMRTLDAVPPEKQRRIARETLDIYAPLANRLGIWEWKTQLEDLGFRYSDPNQYKQLQQMVESGVQERERRVTRYKSKLREAWPKLASPMSRSQAGPNRSTASGARCNARAPRSTRSTTRRPFGSSSKMAATRLMRP